VGSEMCIRDRLYT